jgi:Ca-activated chloride channel family protein
VPEWELRDPLFLLAGLLAPLVYSLAARLTANVTYSSLEILETGPPSRRTRLARLPALLLGLATLALAVALAGPRTGDTTTKIHQEGIAIVMIVDRSGSMQARDFVEGETSLSRLDAVKGVFRDFVLGGRFSPGRPEDLIGLVGFARYADALCPLTLDHGNLTAILDDVQIVEERSEDGTAIGEGLALGVERLRRRTATSKVAILLSDGVANAGEIGPLQAADLAAAHGIRVYTIGAGRTGYAPIPVQTWGGRTVLQRAFVEIDEKTLEGIADRTGGRYFHATDAAGLEQTLAEIDALERSEISEVRYLEYRYHYAAFVKSALALILVATLLSGSALRTLP